MSAQALDDEERLLEEGEKFSDEDSDLHSEDSDLDSDTYNLKAPYRERPSFVKAGKVYLEQVDAEMKQLLKKKAVYDRSAELLQKLAERINESNDPMGQRDYLQTKLKLGSSSYDKFIAEGLDSGVPNTDKIIAEAAKQPEVVYQDSFSFPQGVPTYSPANKGDSSNLQQTRKAHNVYDYLEMRQNHIDQDAWRDVFDLPWEKIDDEALETIYDTPEESESDLEEGEEGASAEEVAAKGATGSEVSGEEEGDNHGSEDSDEEVAWLNPNEDPRLVVLDELAGNADDEDREMREYKLYLKNKVFNPSPRKGFEHDQPTLDLPRDRVYEFDRELKQGQVVDGNAFEAMNDRLSAHRRPGKTQHEDQMVYNRVRALEGHDNLAFDLELVADFHEEQYTYVKQFERLIQINRKRVSKRLNHIRQKYEIAADNRDRLVDEIYSQQATRYEDQVLPSDKSYMEHQREIQAQMEAKQAYNEI